MFVFSFKASSIKVICALFVCIAAALFVITLIPDANSALNVNKIVTDADISFKGVSTNDDRINLLSKLGFEVEKEAVQSGEVKIPKDFDAALEEYNALQQSQGFDLTKYRGKKAMRFTYKILANDNGNTSFATLVVYKDRVVAGDVCCPKTGQYAGIVKVK